MLAGYTTEIVTVTRQETLIINICQLVRKKLNVDFRSLLTERDQIIPPGPRR
jgi:hypothetical protein